METDPQKQATEMAKRLRATKLDSLARLSDDELLTRVRHLVAREREATASLVAHLAELDARRLYHGLGCSSLFTYCTQVLHLSEHAAYLRIEAARAARKFPVLLERLADGSVHLTAVGLLAPHLTEENHVGLLEAARHRTKREVEERIAAIRPLPLVPGSIRKLPAPGSGPGELAATPASGVPRLSTGEPANTVPPSPPVPAPAGVPVPAHRPAVVAPLAPDRFKVQFTASAELCEKLRLAQDLLRHQIPDGDPAAIFDRALTVLLEQIKKQKLAATKRPRTIRWRAASRASEGARPGSRHIPAAVRRAVWTRDGGQCAFTSGDGRRCTERGRLEFHHVEPYARGGPATSGNISLRCRAHNGYEAEVIFGRRYPLAARERVDLYGRNSIRREEPGLDRVFRDELGLDRVFRDELGLDRVLNEYQPRWST